MIVNYHLLKTYSSYSMCLIIFTFNILIYFKLNYILCVTVTGPENGSSQENETQIDAASPSSSVNILYPISIQSLLDY